MGTGKWLSHLCLLAQGMGSMSVARVGLESLQSGAACSQEVRAGEAGVSGEPIWTRGLT